MPVDESALPSVMPISVPRVTADGRPTQHMINWEEVTRNWYYTNAVATDQRITEVKAQSDAAIAEFSEDIQAIADAQGALVTKVDTVEAKADKATATGQIYFAAKAAPSGATAAYGLYLTAGDAFAGMELIAKSGGGSAISFTANQFMLRDSGTAQNVFNYSGGLFTFNVPIRVGTNDIATQAVNAPAAALGSGMISRTSTDGAWLTLVSVSNTGGPGQIAVVSCDFEYTIDGAYNTFIGSWRVIRDDGKVIASASLLGVASYVDRVFINRLDTSFNGTYTYSLQANFNLDNGLDDPPVMIFTARRGLMIDLRKR